MPKLKGISVDDVNNTLHGFQYTNVSIDKLGATEYTIVQTVLDKTGSVSPFKDKLEDILKVSADANKKSPRANNLLYRATAFNSTLKGVDIEEIHGFIPLDQIDAENYTDTIFPDGGTPLFDASLEAVDALYDFGKNLYKQKFLCNAILFIITDGDDNASSKADPNTIKDTINRIQSEGILESFRTILIGVNDNNEYMKEKLEAFKKDAELDEYVSMGEATPGKLAKLAKYVSQSVSSQSQALGSGGPSQPIDFTF